MHHSGPLQGHPLSWAHYVYGMAARNRAKAADKLAMYDAASMAAVNTAPESVKEWVNKLNMATL